MRTCARLPDRSVAAGRVGGDEVDGLGAVASGWRGVGLRATITAKMRGLPSEPVA